jgi:hypothetical protein
VRQDYLPNPSGVLTIERGQLVAPHAGAWIETGQTGIYLLSLPSRPTRARGLKHRQCRDRDLVACRNKEFAEFARCGNQHAELGGWICSKRLDKIL